MNIFLPIFPSLKHALDDLLRKDADMAALYLSQANRETHQHQNVERLLEAYTQDLMEILNEIRNLRYDPLFTLRSGD